MFCSSCGKKLAEGSKFCPGCGTKVGNITNRQKNEDLKDNISEYEDEDEDEEDEDEDKSSSNKSFINSLVEMRIKMDCVDMDSSFDDIMNTVGSKIFLSAEQCFMNKDYDKAIEYFQKYIKINDNLISHYRLAQSFILLASLQAENEHYKANFLNIIENALNISNKMCPIKKRGKFKLFKLKGHALSLQADYFNFMKKVSMGDGKEEEESYKASILNAIKSYIESLNFADSESSKSEVLLKIGKLFFDIEDCKEALNYFKQCLSTLEHIKEYDTAEKEIIDNSMYFSIWCYSQLGDAKNTAIMLSEFLKEHQGEDIDEIDEDLPKLKKELIKNGYGDYFDND